MQKKNKIQQIFYNQYFNKKSMTIQMDEYFFYQYLYLWL